MPSSSDRRDPSSLVGRARELAVLHDALDAALAGRGSLVLIGGEAGIGKTALAEWLLSEAAAQGAVVLVGRCYDLAETPPYGPWRETFDRAPSVSLPMLPTAVLPPERTGESLTNQQAIISRVRTYLAALAAIHPVVMLLEDLHWADPASLDLLRVATRDLGGTPLLLLATYRADEIATDHSLVGLLPALVREARAERLDLSPLDAVAIGQLVASRYTLGAADRNQLVSYLARRSEGNALFLSELLRTIESAGTLRREGDGWVLADPDRLPVPPLLRQVIAGRLARLGEEDRRILEIAAVIGQEPPIEIWKAVAEVEEEALLATAERAITARVLEPTDTGVRFAHALIRETLYAGVLAPRRRAWHRWAGEALLVTPAPDPDALAHHFGQAGDARAFAWLLRAGLRAERVSAWLTAAERFTAAATLLDGERSRDRERGWLLFFCGRLHLFTDVARSLRYLDEAEPLARASDDQILLAYIRFMRGNWRCLLGEVRLGVAEMMQDIAALDALLASRHPRMSHDVRLAMLEEFVGDGEGETSAIVQPADDWVGSIHRNLLIHWMAIAGHYRETLALGEPFVRKQVEVLGDEYLRTAGPALCGIALAQAALGHPAEARETLARARTRFNAFGDPFMVECTWWYELLLVLVPYRADAVTERSRAVTEGASAWARAMGVTMRAAHASLTALPLAIVSGHWGEARQLAEAGLGAAILGHRQGATIMLGMLARHQGDPDLAWTQVRKLHPAGAANEPGDCVFDHGMAALALAAALALDAGDLPVAREWLEAHDRWVAWGGTILWSSEGHQLWARYQRQVGNLVLARRHAEEALMRATAPRQPLALLAAHRALGELDTASCQYHDARAQLAISLTLADACAAPYERALTLLALTELYLEVGQHETAARDLAEAQAICAELQAHPALARGAEIAARLRGATSPVVAPAVTPRYPARLTAREAEVLRLIAAGKSNREIAALLCRSERTVERHIEHLYRKIDAHSKADATAFAFRHHLA